MAKDIDLLIRGGKVYDGTGDEPLEADIAVVNDRIAFISLPSDNLGEKAKIIIDLNGLSVAPGFIDTHSHSEFTLLADNRAEGKVLQGVTTEVNGNCGLSAAPLYGDALRHRETDFNDLGIKERWNSLRDYFSILERTGLPINFATLAGHGNIRASVIGYGDRKPDESDMQKMCMLLKEAIGDGAIGLSTGLIYPPGVYAETEELITLAKCVNTCIYTSHMRSEGNRLIDAINESIRIGRESGIAVHISHIKTSGRANWHKIDEAISLIEAARGEGISVTCDRYPYTAASTDLDAVLPSWTYAGGAEEELRRLKDKRVCPIIKNEVLSNHPSDDYWRNITISSVNSEPNKWMEGKTLSYISDRVGKKPVDFLVDILVEERLRIGAIFNSMNEDNLKRILSLPYVMVGSDSSARSTDGPTHKGKPHPRGFGTFPRFIGRYSRNNSDMALRKAIHKITMLPAQTFGLKERGQIRAGFMADLVIFDENTILDRATFDEPYLRAEGIDYVFVNGQPVVWEGTMTGVMAGRVLRHGGQYD